MLFATSKFINAGAAEHKVEMSNQVEMRKIGEGIGKNLVTQGCQPFVKLSMIMANGLNYEEQSTNITEGQLKRIETKDFNYFIFTGSDNKEKSFIWFRQFPGSENFISDPGKYIGKKMKISWKEVEVYIPTAKNYYKIKEITNLEFQ